MGSAVCERTIASTSQMLDPATGDWAFDVLKTYNIPDRLFAPPTATGSIIGQYKDAKVVAVAGHDTQCAVAALPTNADNIAFLSCGTWSLLGCELDAPLTVDTTLSNEIGANGKINYLKNIIGLWLIQESRRSGNDRAKIIPTLILKSSLLQLSPFIVFY